jgi:hypothetical protein
MTEIAVATMTRPVARAKILWGTPFGRSVDPIVVKAFIRLAMGQGATMALADPHVVRAFLGLLAVACQGDPKNVTDDMLLSFMQLVASANLGNVEFIDVPYMATAAAHNYMAQYLLNRSDATHLIILQDDHVCPPDIVSRLLRWWQEDNGKQVIAALTFRRPMPHDALCVVENPDGTGGTMAPPYPESLFQLNGVCGCGAILIHRGVFEVVPPPWFFVEIGPDGITQTTEDYPFCRKVRKFGVNIWVDPTCVSPHLGVQLIDKTSFKMDGIDPAMLSKTKIAMQQ